LEEDDLWAPYPVWAQRKNLSYHLKWERNLLIIVLAEFFSMLREQQSFRMPHREQESFHTKNAKALRAKTGPFRKLSHLVSKKVLSRMSAFRPNTQLPVEISAMPLSLFRK